jgi:serine/threonine protein kinase
VAQIERGQALLSTLVDVERYGVGDTIGGQFELLERLGAGGFGAVFRARSLIDDNEYAIKLLYKDGGLERVKREFLPLKRIDHANIVRGIQAGQTGEGVWYLVSELVEGQSLDQRLEETGVLDLDDLRQVGMQLLAALAVMHPDEERIAELRELGQDGSLDPEQLALLQELQAGGLVHRDIKPANLIIEASGRLVLVDFGISSRAGTVARTASATEGFVPPDLPLGAIDRWDPDVDRYAAGVTLYLAACGVHPADREHVDPLDEILDPGSTEDGVPAGLRSFLLRACWPKREERFSSTTEMLDAWQRIDWDLDMDIAHVANLSPFVPWLVQTYPDESNLTDEQLRSLIVQIVDAEGPVICARLYDLVFEATGSRPTTRLNQLVYRMASAWNGRLAQVEPLGGGQQNKTVFIPGTDPRAFRTLGERRADHLPSVEFQVHVEHARRVLGLADSDEVEPNEILPTILATLSGSDEERDRAERAVKMHGLF